ncbi:MAG TPA: hypothetical protein VKA46_16000 [Gemmataceae bacterium]|nr:hypothetical protein [Gemmataceae bacterium]
MIELTPEQWQAVERGEPVRLVDDTTHDTYILMRAEVYEQTAGVLQPPADEAASLIQPAMLRAQQAFWRDLPELLKDRRNHGKWVAYHGDERVGFGRDDGELYRTCLQHGLERGEFYVARIRERDVPPWEPTFLEQSLYEATDLRPDDAPPSSA